jgi:hypothetical protein
MKNLLDAGGHRLRILWRSMMTRCATTVLCSAVVGLFLSTVCFAQSERTSSQQTVFGVLNDLQIAKINELIDAKLKTLTDSQTAKINELIDAKLKTLNSSQAEKFNQLIANKLKTFNESQTAKTNEMIDLKLKTLSDSQIAKVNDLIETKLRTLNDSQVANVSERQAIVSSLSTLNEKIDDIRRHQSQQREYVVEQEDECTCRGDLRWSYPTARDRRR